MKKTLISVDNLAEHICRGKAEIHMDGTKILTAGAKDELAKRGIAVVYGSCPTSQCCDRHASSGAASPMVLAGLAQAKGEAAGLEQLLLGIAAMLKTEYGVQDPAELKALSLQAIQTIKNNI